LPKYFNIFALLESNIKVMREATVYSKPTYFSEIILDKNVEFTLAYNAMFKVKIKDKKYISKVKNGKVES